MASRETLRTALELCVSNFGTWKSEQYVEDMLAVCAQSPTVQGASDASLQAAFQAYMESPENKKAPRLGDIVGALRAGGQRSQSVQGPECAECGSTGWREGSCRTVRGAIEGPWALVCGCRPFRGVPWGGWLDQQRRRADVDQVWVTGRGYLRLPNEARMNDAELSALEERKGVGQVIQFDPQGRDVHAAERRRIAQEAHRGEG